MNDLPFYSRSTAAGKLFTGRKVVLLRPGLTYSEVRKSSGNAALKLASSGDYASDFSKFHQAFEAGDGLIFETLGIAVLNETREQQIRVFSATGIDPKVLLIEPERYVFCNETNRIWNIESQPESGKRRAGDIENKAVSSPSKSEQLTWGLKALDIANSLFTGKNVRIAVLDTGIAYAHPDFSGRRIKSLCFTGDSEVWDYNGHGTHCAGIAAGNINAETGLRYGVAREAKLYCLKVLNNAGIGKDGDILAGIEWALKNRCSIISLSLGAMVEKGTSWSGVFNAAATQALKKGSIIIAAAGNESRREQGYIAQVNHPANCPAVLAVAALDEKLKPASFSCAGTNPLFGQIDISAPGTNIYSACLFPPGHTLSNGTIMAAPFVTGVAALLKQAYPKASAYEIWMRLVQNAARLKYPSRDVGAGLVKVPV